MRIAHERAFLPVYIDRFPASDAATVCGTVKVKTIPAKALKGGSPTDANKWRRALLKIVKLPKEQAQSALLDLPEVFSPDDIGSGQAAQIDVALFEFLEIDAHIVQPAILCAAMVS